MAAFLYAWRFDGYIKKTAGRHHSSNYLPQIGCFPCESQQDKKGLPGNVIREAQCLISDLLTNV